MKEKKQAQASQTNNQHSFFSVVKAFPPELRQLLLSDILIRFCERIPYAFVILWAMNKGGINAFEFSILVTIEMAVAAICYIPVAHFADKYGQGPFVLITFVFFTLFPISLIFAHSFPLLALAFAIRGLKEFGEPARKALIISYAPRDLKSKAYGAYYLIRDVIVTSGSFLGAFLWSISPYANFIGAACLGAGGAIVFFSLSFSKSFKRS
jgi:MFS family permease